MREAPKRRGMSQASTPIPVGPIQPPREARRGRHGFGAATVPVLAGFGTLAAAQVPATIAPILPRVSEQVTVTQASPLAGLADCARSAQDMSSLGRLNNAACVHADKAQAMGLGAFRRAPESRVQAQKTRFSGGGLVNASGLHREGAAWYAQYEKGRVYVPDATGQPIGLRTDIVDAYKREGGASGPLGYPTSDERPHILEPSASEIAGNTDEPLKDGRLANFQNGDIFWWPDTRAMVITGAHRVRGSISRLYARVGGPGGWLGAPITGELPIEEGGALSRFENGSIYWWPDIGAKEIGRLRLVFAGIKCDAENDGLDANGSDEPYFIFGVYPVKNGQPLPVQTASTGIFGGVDAGGEYAAVPLQTIFDGDVDGLVVAISALEQDEGDPKKYESAIAGAMRIAGTGAAAAFGADAQTATAVGAIAAEVGKAFNALLNTGDDYIGSAHIALSTKQLVALADHRPLQQAGAVRYHVASPPLTADGEGSYKVYFEIEKEP